MEYIAHLTENGRMESVEEHLEKTAKMCSEFAKEFGAGEVGRLMGALHDIGKYSNGFQKRIRGGAKVDHATAGAIECGKLGVIQAAMCVIGHHSGLPNYGSQKTDQPGDSTFCGRIKNGLKKGGIEPYLDNWNVSIKKDSYNLVEPDYAKGGFSGAFWTRMLYSCLVDADYLCTEQFMNPDIERFSGYASMTELELRLENYIQKWKEPEGVVNQSRWDFLNTCMRQGKQDKGLFSLSLPTGGGKTVASLAFAIKHAIAHGMKRIIYVIPYTSIIDQNAKEFKKILGEENVLEHHSGIEYNLDENPESKDYLRALATENWDCPVIVTTAVQFFESFYANRSSKCRKLHNVANSVIIFDEAQMIPACHLKPCVRVISELVEHYGASAVLCTATQPDFRGLLTMEPMELCPEAESMAENFRRAVFRKEGKIEDEKLVEMLLQEEQVLCIVNSRKAAQNIFQLLDKEGTYHLSTLMYPEHRKRILEEVRQRLKAGKTCRLIATSLMEAGVDVDFPTVYREMNGLDSILQAAGRCNREGKRPAEECVVHIFQSQYKTPILQKINIAAAEEALSKSEEPNSAEAIQRYFSSYRDFLGDSIDECRIIDVFENGISGCRLPFKDVAEKFHLIDNATKTIYIPCENSVGILKQLQEGNHSRSLYRKAGQYAVAVYPYYYEKLWKCGAVENLDENSGILVLENQYDEKMGLSLTADESFLNDYLEL